LAPLLAGANVALGDVTAMSAVAALIARVNHVVYAVGSSSPVESDLDPASDVIIVVPPVVRLLELLRLRPSVGVTYLSSGGVVYGNIDTPTAGEDTRPEPISSYGILKLTVERFLTSYALLHHIPVRILRVSNAYGPGQPWAKGQGIVARLIHCASTGELFSVYGDGSNVRDYVYIDDVTQTVSALVSHKAASQVLNVGSGVGHSVMDVIRVVEDTSGRQIKVQYLDRRPFDVSSIVLDISRVSGMLDYRPLELREGVRRTWRSNFVAVASDNSPSALLRVPHVAQ
jgi:UDP-glucose 4-epimerase